MMCFRRCSLHPCLCSPDVESTTLCFMYLSLGSAYLIVSTPSSVLRPPSSVLRPPPSSSSSLSLSLSLSRVCGCVCVASRKRPPNWAWSSSCVGTSARSATALLPPICKRPRSSTRRPCVVVTEFMWGYLRSSCKRGVRYTSFVCQVFVRHSTMGCLFTRASDVTKEAL
jgi:hypothetical protein